MGEQTVAPASIRRPPLVMTKLNPPPGRTETLLRDRLVERLHAGADAKLTLIAAPAGYGKTTLLGTLARGARGDEAGGVAEP